MKKHILLLGFAFFIAPIHFVQAEYIFCKKSNGTIKTIADPNEHAKIFNILMKYQAPMSFNSTFNHKTELTIQEIKLLHIDEQKLLEQKLRKTVNPNLHVMFVPTIFYELFIIKLFAKKLYPHNDNFFLTKVAFPSKNIPYAFQTFEKMINKTNTSSKMQKLHFFVNKMLLGELLKTNDIPLKPLSTHKIANKYIHELQKVSYKKIKQFTDSLKNKASRFLIHKSINLEYKAQKRNFLIIYRGTNGFAPEVYDDSLILDNTSAEFLNNMPKKPKYKYGPHSLSYGTSLLAAAFNGYSEICAHKFCAQYRNLGYALRINKNGYYNKKTPYLIFYIPPHSTLSSLFESEIFFHTRTRIDKNSKTSVSVDNFTNHMRELLKTRKEKTANDLRSRLERCQLISAYLSSIKSSLSLQDLEKQFNLFISKNIMFLKTDTNVTFRNKKLEQKLIKKHLIISKKPYSCKNWS